MPCLSSFAVTSSQMQTNCLPPPGLGSSGGGVRASIAAAIARSCATSWSPTPSSESGRRHRPAPRRDRRCPARERAAARDEPVVVHAADMAGDEQTGPGGIARDELAEPVVPARAGRRPAPAG